MPVAISTEKRPEIPTDAAHPRNDIIEKNTGKEDTGVDIIQDFYDHLATQYDKLFLDWQATTHEQGTLLDKLIRDNGFDPRATVLDCACGIGTQAIGLARLGYCVTASDISREERKQAIKRAADAGVNLPFEIADFRELSKTFSERFDVVIAMDNALPHMLSREDLERAVGSIVGQIKEKGMFIGSIRDYDALLQEKPPYSAPYIHETTHGKRVSFQTWDWQEDHYRLTQYIIDDENTLSVSKFSCEYRATRRQELTELFVAAGCQNVTWLFPDQTGFYQPIVIAEKG